MSENSKVPIKCRAAVLHNGGSPFKIEEVVINPPKNGQVRLQMVSAGVCGTDAHYAWGIKQISHPMILGHEGAAIVESVGPNVTKVVPGDHVLTTFMPQCKQCRLCHREDTNLCKNLAIKHTPLTANDPPKIKEFGLGVFSEYVLVKQSQIVKIRKEVRLAHACIISCSVATGFYSATNMAKVTQGSTCAVWGLGGIGLNALFGCKHNGAKHIVGIDTNDDKQGVAKEFGCTEFINPKKLNKPVEDYLKETYDGGVDFAFECVGSMETINTGLKSLDSNGTFVQIGGIPSDTMINYPANELLESNRKIIGGLLGNKKPDKAFEEIVEMYIDGKYDVDRLISNKFTLNQINEAFDTLKDGKCIRAVIQF